MPYIKATDRANGNRVQLGYSVQARPYPRSATVLDNLDPERKLNRVRERNLEVIAEQDWAYISSIVAIFFC